jgi:SAM-dependent methyltransferase
VKSLFNRAIAQVRRKKNPSALQYWEDRARTYGPRSVLNLSHAETEMDAVTKKQEFAIFPHLAKELRGDETKVLDFGCGPGRFTLSLARLTNADVVGVDPIRAFLRWAPQHRNVVYRRLVDGRIPLDACSVDVIWVCLVLGAISDTALPQTASEFDRVLRPGGLLFLTENTSPKPSNQFWSFRTIEQYRSTFPFAKLSHLGDYEDVGERISILSGRKMELASGKTQMDRTGLA